MRLEFWTQEEDQPPTLVLIQAGRTQAVSYLLELS